MGRLLLNEYASYTFIYELREYQKRIEVNCGSRKTHVLVVEDFPRVQVIWYYNHRFQSYNSVTQGLILTKQPLICILFFDI